MLTRVVSTYDGGRSSTRIGDGQSVISTVSNSGSICDSNSARKTIGTLQHQSVIINPQLANAGACPAKGVGAWILISGGGVGGDNGIGVVGRCSPPTSNIENTADSKGCST